MIRKSSSGVLSAYMPKKDLEEPVVTQELESLWGGTVTLANGWVLALPEMAVGTRLTITVEERRISGV